MDAVMANPPDTLAGLKLLLEAIERREADISLGSSSRRILSALIAAPQRAAVSSISELAEQLGVNPSTFSRLAQKLGYGGFSKFQDVFRREVTEGRTFYSDQASRLLVPSGSNDSIGQLTRLGRQESANMASMIEQVDCADFDATVELLTSARRVRIHGMRQFTSLALFMAYALGMLRPDVAPLDAARQGVADALAQLDEGDVLVVASCFPYTPSVLATAEVAARHGIKVIALTDSSSSPLVRIARHSFYVPNQSLFFSNSMCAFMLLAEGILSGVASRLGEASVAALKHREMLITELNASL
jgi:DNA-binding MurR/RpiR family transcriptional regulator